jgi:hypothetical protein
MTPGRRTQPPAAHEVAGVHGGDSNVAGVAPVQPGAGGVIARCEKGKEGAEGASDVSYAEAQSAFVELSKRLGSSKSLRDRALGRYAGMIASSTAASGAYAATHPGCAEDPACGSEQIELMFRRPDADGVAELASSSDDPGVYALGIYACRTQQKPGAGAHCGALSAARWAQLEPGNAVPWLLAADDAARRGDSGTRDEAFFRASRAEVIDPHLGAFADLLQSDVVRSQSSGTQFTMAVAIFGELAISDPGPFILLRDFCSVTAVSDPNRRQVCGDLAELMTGRADSLMRLSVGTELGKRTGWSPDRVSALRDLKEAIMEVGREESVAQVQRLGSGGDCGPLPQSITERLRHGEVSPARRAIAASGMTTAQLVERGRRNMEEQQRRFCASPAAEDPTMKGVCDQAANR